MFIEGLGGSFFIFSLISEGESWCSLKVLQKYRHPVVVPCGFRSLKTSTDSFIGPNGAGNQHFLGMSRLLPKDEEVLYILTDRVEAWNSNRISKRTCRFLKQNQQVHVSMTVGEFVRFGRFPLYERENYQRGRAYCRTGASEYKPNLSFAGTQDIGTLSEGSTNERSLRWF